MKTDTEKATQLVRVQTCRFLVAQHPIVPGVERLRAHESSTPAERGTKRWGLQRLIWTGEMPFEVKTMRAKPDGFELTFTMPIDRQLAAAVERYEFESYTYKLESRYGGPEADKKKLEIQRVEVAADGTELLHRVAYYTLVKLPK